MAEPLRHQHGKAARHQERRQRVIVRLRHLRATQRVLGGRMRDHGEAERPVARRAEQQRMRRPLGCRHQPLLRAIWLALGANRPESRRLAGQNQQHDGRVNGLEPAHEA